MSTTEQQHELLELNSLRCAAGTDIGMLRRENQDSFGIIRNASFHAYFVADGMGGTQGGAVASRMTISALERELEQTSLPPSVDELQGLLKKINEEIFTAGQTNPGLAGMGTTLVGLVFSNESVVSLYVGDSRAYRIRANEINQISEDHTLIKELIKTGAVDPSEESSHPISHMLTKSLGPTANIRIDCTHYQHPAQPGDSYILCSDGLYNYVSEEEILSVALQNSPDDASQILINLANQRGGADNITLLIVSVDSDQQSRLNRTFNEFDDAISDQDTYLEEQATAVEGKAHTTIVPPPVQEPRDMRAERRTLREQRRKTDTKTPSYSVALLLGVTLVAGLAIGNLGKSISSAFIVKQREVSQSSTTFSDIMAKIKDGFPGQDSDQYPSKNSLQTKHSKQPLSINTTSTNKTATTTTAQTFDSVVEAAPQSTSPTIDIDKLKRMLDSWKRKSFFLEENEANYLSPLLLDTLENYSEAIQNTRMKLENLSAQIVATENYSKIHPDKEEVLEELKSLKRATAETRKQLHQSVHELVQLNIDSLSAQVNALQSSKSNNQP
jgi:serine/threonine protein phosphatase PrpC